MAVTCIEGGGVTCPAASDSLAERTRAGVVAVVVDTLSHIDRLLLVEREGTGGGVEPMVWPSLTRKEKPLAARERRRKVGTDCIAPRPLEEAPEEEEGGAREVSMAPLALGEVRIVEAATTMGVRPPARVCAPPGVTRGGGRE